jgi:carbamoyl-phosphate synthase small subunit
MKDFNELVPARLILHSGEIFEGQSFAWQTDTAQGEVVFTTGMTGYVESLTDPSFAGQILTFTYPLIGNYGVPAASFWESGQSHVRGAVFSELSPFHNHFRATHSLAQWLCEHRIPMISGVDTRALTKVLRTQGAALGAIATGQQEIQRFDDPNRLHLVSEVSIAQPHTYGKGKKKIIAVDCGMKENIIRSLLHYPITIKRVPYNYDYSDESYDGVFLSNGPGDPTMCTETVAILQKALNKKKPVFGICLGAQLLALAIGAKTYKLPFGHRGQNQPCHSVENKKCFLTSQNHGYAIDEKTLPKEWKVTFYNLNDNSVEGIAHRSLPFFAVQFHPEAAPGPVDTQWLFQQFYAMM